MKKMFSYLMILASLVFVVNAHAWGRTAQTNVYASWVSAVSYGTTITFPANSRDICIQNGWSSDICVSLDGTAFATSVSPGSCYTTTSNRSIQIDNGTTICLQDFVTSSIIVRPATGVANASPVSVIVTY